MLRTPVQSSQVPTSANGIGLWTSLTKPRLDVSASFGTQVKNRVFITFDTHVRNTSVSPHNKGVS